MAHDADSTPCDFSRPIARFNLNRLIARFNPDRLIARFNPDRPIARFNPDHPIARFNPKKIKIKSKKYYKIKKFINSFV